jgi:hypothetical protein
MTLQELFDRVMINSGQFEFGNDRIDLQEEKFKILTEMCVGVYNGYSPINTHIFKEINFSRQYTFTESNTPEGIPEEIVDLVPVRISGVLPYYLREYDRPKSQLDIKVEFPFVYRKPTLTVPISAEYDLHVIYKHKVTSIGDSDQPKYEIKTLSDGEDEFINLVTGKFMQIIGRNRRAFTLNELPITSDAAELVSEGKEIEREALEDLIENKGKFYLAWR